MPDILNPSSPYLTIIANYDRISRVFTNDVNDFGEALQAEPVNYLQKASDCSSTDYLSLQYNILNKILYLRTNIDNLPTIPNNLKYDLFINRTRFNIDEELDFEQGNLEIDFNLSDDTWELYSNVRVALSVGSDSSIYGCTFVEVIDWSNVDDIELVRDGDYFYLTYPEVGPNIIFNKDELEIEWLINDTIITLEAFDEDDKIYMPISRVNELLDSTSDKYTILAKIPQLNTNLVSDVMFVTQTCNFTSSITQVIDGTSIMYNYKIVNNDETIKFAIYDSDSSELISSNGLYSFDQTLLDTNITIVCYGIDDIIEENLNNLVDGKYIGIKDDILTYTGTNIESTFGCIIVSSNDNSLVNNVGEEFNIDIRDISLGAEFTDCDYTDKFIPDSTSTEFHALQFSDNNTEPFDGMMIEGDPNLVHDECLKSFPFDIGELIMKGEMPQDDN